MADTSGTECSNRQIQDNPEQEKTGKSFDFPAIVDYTGKISNLLEDLKKVVRFSQSIESQGSEYLIGTESSEK